MSHATKDRVKVRHYRVGFCLLLSALLVSSLFQATMAAEQIDPNKPAEIITPLMRSAPQIDGVIDEAEWRDATRVVGLIPNGSTVLSQRKATFWFGCDGQRVFIAMRSELPPKGKLVARMDERDSSVVSDDSIEVWLAPHYGKTAGDRRYFHFMGNTLGAIFDIAHNPAEQWQGDWQFKNRITKQAWEAEASVSLASLGATADDLARQWRVRVCRDWKQPWGFTSWSSCPGPFSDTNTMTRVRWDASAPIVRMLSMGDLGGGKMDFQLELRNPGEKPLALKAKFEVQSTNQPWFSEKDSLTLAPGESKVLSMKRNFWPTDYFGEILVTSADGKKTFFRRNFAWKKSTGSPWVIVKKGEQKDVNFDVAYYPYHKKLRTRVKFGSEDIAKKVKRASITLSKQGESGKIASGDIENFQKSGTETVIDTPDLDGGTYEVRLVLMGDKGALGKPIIKTFKRTVWPWEHNKIGISRMVIPPFTPIKVNGNVVDTILRSHTMNGFGLWDQVVAKDEPILAGPIRFEARALGQTVSLETTVINFTEKSPDRVKALSRFFSEPLQGQVLSEWDYDGMMKVTLELAATGKSVESLDLIIPLKAQVAKLMHASADTIRTNPAGAIPQGNGVVWDSTKIIRRSTYGTWIPYVWIGGAYRGVCWFADTDRDWSLDDEKPAIDIVRQGDTVQLRVHLINKPTVLDRPRRIVFGLQATPVKPLPKNWRSWNFYCKAPAPSQRYLILGQCQTWGGIGAYSEVYPRGRDFSIFDEFARIRKGGEVNSAWLDKWMKGYRTRDKEKLADLRPNVFSSLVTVGKADKVIPYTNARGSAESSCEETRSFNQSPLTGANWDEPIRSFQDFALFYFKKMMDRGIEGIYYDCTYLKSNTDMISADAYVHPDGKIHPSVGLFSMRDLIKRTAVMYAQAGKEPLIVNHMTNANIVPMMSFSTVALEWEDKYGADDFQDKFSLDFIMAESTGLQTGNVPLVLGGVITKDKAEFLRLSRTEFGVAMVHEIKIWNDGKTRGLIKAHLALYEFGYGRDDCKVYRYWDGSGPVKVQGSDTRCLVLSRPGKALVLVTDFGTGGDITVTVDTKALGLKKGFAARDAETQQKLTVVKGQIKFNLKKHDFRMIVLE